MTNISFSRHLVAIVATLFVSTACVVGAVGPAATVGTSAAVVGQVTA